MVIQLSGSLEQAPELLDRVHSVGPNIERAVRRYSQTARAIWDAHRDERGRWILTLALVDAWGAAARDFGPDEVQPGDPFDDKLHEMVGDMLNPRDRSVPVRPRRVRIEIKDKLVDESQIDLLRRHLGQIPQIQTASLQQRNRVQDVPGTPQRKLVTNFTVEVDASVESEVRAVIRDCGFELRESPLLHQPGVRDAVKRLVEAHHGDGQPPPRFAICFNTSNPHDVHLVEIADEAAEMEDAALEGIGMSAGASIPGARSMVLYLTSPNDLRRAFRANPDHPFFRDLGAGRCDFIWPDDGGEQFFAEFGEFSRPQR